MRDARASLAWLCVLALAGCASGPEQRPAQSADARLAEPARSVPQASQFVQQAEARLAENDAPGAHALLEQALRETPDDPRALLDLGIVREMLDDKQGAESAYRKAIEVDGTLAEALNNLGVLVRERGALDEAVALLVRATRANPHSASAHANLALAFEDAGDGEGAKREYASALEIEPNDAMVRANYGLLLVQLGDSPGAIEHLSRAASAAQGNRAALLAIGNGLRRAGDANGALRAMESAVQAGSEAVTPALLAELALAQRAADQRDAAIATLEKALGIDERYATAHYLLANMLAADRRFPEASQHYQRYLKLAPDGEQAKLARERLDVIQKRKK